MKALLPALGVLGLLAAPPLSGAGWAADPPRGGWKGMVKKAVDIADELAAYPVRHDVFLRCIRTLGNAREAMEEAGAAFAVSPPVAPPGLADRLRDAGRELQLQQRQVRDVVLEFSKGLEVSYEGAFSDFGARGEELAALLGRVRDVLGAAESRFRAGSEAS